jgi:aldehyde dehydrogenase (NAD+)
LVDLELPTGILIGGDWRHSTSAGELEHINPATGRPQKAFPVAGIEEIDGAVAAARTGLDDWHELGVAGRRQALQKVAAGFRERATELTRIGVAETGLINMISGFMPHSAAEWFEYYAGWCDKLSGDLLSVPGSFDYVLLEPVGVVGVILTWNTPVGGSGMSVAAPLAAGCSVVLKAPELSPFSACLIGQIGLDAGLPPGVLNIVVGGPEAGDALVRHPEVDKIVFTGSPATGRRIQAAAADTLKPLVLELGGKSANVVFEDADLDAAVTSAAMGVCMMNGQTCVAPTRLLVQRTIYDEVVSGVREAMGNVALGDPALETTQMGPVITAQARARIQKMIAEAQQNGSGKLLVGGGQPSGALADGFYVEPTAFFDVDNSSEIAQNEIFGPVLAVMPFDDEEEAVSLANATDYGLAAYLHTKDLSRAISVAGRLRAGNIAVNAGLPMVGPYAPFGGVKQSGYGRQGSREGINEFLRTKNVNIA